MSLFFHQVEEYKYPGTFPFMLNHVMFNSKNIDRYPLNTNTALIINVYIGWSSYILALFIGKYYLFLGVATMLIALGNIIAHILLFNIKGKTLYNAGLFTSCTLFIPSIIMFIKWAIDTNVMNCYDLTLGIVLGVLINILGVFKLIQWLSNKNTTYSFNKNNFIK